MWRWHLGLAAWVLAQLLGKGIFSPLLCPVAVSPPTPPLQPTMATGPQGSLDCEKGKQSQGLPCSTQESPSGSLSSFSSGAFLISLMKPSYLWVKKKKKGDEKQGDGKKIILWDYATMMTQASGLAVVLYPGRWG